MNAAHVLLLLLTAPSTFEERWLAIEGHLGLGTPLGFGGIALDLAPVEWLSFNAGVGIGGAGFPPQVALLARFRPIAGFGIAVGVSGGPYKWVEGGILAAAVDHGAEKEWDFAVWFDGDVSYEFRLHYGFLIRPYFGAGYLLNNGAGACTTEQIHCESEHQNGGRFLIYSGIAMGYAFDI